MWRVVFRRKLPSIAETKRTRPDEHQAPSGEASRAAAGAGIAGIGGNGAFQAQPVAACPARTVGARRLRRMPLVHRHMSRDLLAVEAGAPIVAVAQQMADRNVGAVLVQKDGRLAGIMTERDLMRAVGRGLRDDAVVGECMTANPDTIAPDDTIEHAAVLMIHGGYRHLPVVDGDDVVGVLSIRDLVPMLLEDSAPRGA
jgi:CBS domain-containing protein